MTEQKQAQFQDKTKQSQPGVQFQVEEKPPVRALVLVPLIDQDHSTKANLVHVSIQDRIGEAEGLALAIDLELVPSEIVTLHTIRPATLLGSGKVDLLKHKIHAQDVELVIVDHPLSPGQQRNLEREWQVKILDRTGLILEIFGRRASTREGRLQVELAHLTYQKSRLVRSWTHLERQRGGGGFMGGPGETQLEADKRHLQSKIISLSKELEKVKKTRQLHRKKRRKVPYPVIALVGYTNAGKSTLFNRVTGAKVVAKDQLFATLDPTMRAIELPGGNKAILSDTVGFISNLPTQLVASFRATLEEVLEADLILHVEDISNPNREAHRRDVVAILKDLGVNQDNKDHKTPILTIWNKIDSFDDTLPVQENIEAEEEQAPLLVSAKTGQGIPLLLQTIAGYLQEHDIELDLSLTPAQGGIVSWLYEHATVTQGETLGDGTTQYHVILPKRLSGRLEKMMTTQT